MTKTTKYLSSLLFALILSAGCVDRVEVEGRPCPCADGYRCVDNRCVGSDDVTDPEATAWTISDIDLGQPGWRDSTELFAPPPVEYGAIGAIWSHPDFVAVMYTGTAADGDTSGERLWSLLTNDGKGWVTRPLSGLTADASAGPVMSPNLLRGTPDGRLFHATRLSVIASFAPDDLDGNSAVAPVADFELVDLSVVQANRAYALGSGKLLQFDGSSWSPVPAALPYDVDGVWADENVVYAVGGTGTILSLSAGSTQWRIHDSGTTQDFSRVWGFADDDVYAASADELHHYDGTDWRRVLAVADLPESGDGRDSIEGLWGSQGSLYIRMRSHLLRYRDGAHEVVGSWPCALRKMTDEEIEAAQKMPSPPSRGNLAEDEVCAGGLVLLDFWGNAADEVFLLVRDHDDALSQRLAVLRYDGATFRQM